MTNQNHVRDNWSRLKISPSDQDFLEQRLSELWILLNEPKLNKNHVEPIVKKIRFFESLYGIHDYDKPLKIEPPEISLDILQKKIERAKKNKPYIIGLVGPPGSGKSTLLNLLRDRCGNDVYFCDEYWDLNNNHPIQMQAVKDRIDANQKVVVAAGFIVNQDLDTMVYVEQPAKNRLHNISSRSRDDTDLRRTKNFEWFKTFDFHVYELEKIKADFKVKMPLRY